MKYTKLPLSFEAQADLLLSRGMKGDRAVMIARLSVVNYYRLSGYWHPFRQPDGTFKLNTTFDAVWQRYTFDRRLRLLVMDAIERVEVAIRTQLAYHLAHQSGDPFAYADDRSMLPNLTADEQTRLLAELGEQYDRSRETFAGHFRTKYGTDHTQMPVWMACEIMTFGNMLTIYRGVPPDVRRAVAAPMGVHDVVMGSWLLALNTVRNICAHHGRLWNRELGTKPKIPEPRKNPQWHDPVVIPNDRVFGILTICQHCLRRIAPQTGWSDRWRALLQEYPYVPRGSMGVPKDWEASPIWN